MNEAPERNGIPRGALAVVVVGLIATVAAALLATDRSSGAAAELEWVQEASLPDSAVASVPGGSGEMRLTDAGLKATGTNFSGYSLYRVAATLRIDAGSAVGGGRIVCSTRGPGLVAQTPKLRASYPRSSEKLEAQPIPEVILVEYSSHGGGLAVVDATDLFADGFTTEDGIKVEWPTYVESNERIQWFLPPGPPPVELVLPFTTVWKTAKVPATRLACTVTTSAGTATVRTHGRLPGLSPPIDEEAEERAREEEAAEAE